jgi:6-pyruvoyltetrahydropterin/6-carboxytetrahydropterin synthase
MKTQIFYEFAFDAAHRFEHLPEGEKYPPGHKFRGLHGHSFQVEVALRGTPDARTGFIVDFGDLEQACGALRETLDHSYLNDIDGLAQPSLEHIAAWIWRRLAPRLAGLDRVSVRRDSCRQGCNYFGPVEGTP